MKNLEMYGVQEMDAKEMKKTDGGWLRFLLGIMVAEFLDRDKEADFAEGYNDFIIDY